MKEPIFYNLFPTPVYESNIGREFTKEELDYVQECGIDTYKNAGNTTSLDRYILEHPSMKNIKEFVEKNINIFFDKIQAPLYDIKPYVTQSWLNYTSPGQYHHKHAHPNSFISGVLYFNASGEDDKITLYNPRYDYILEVVTENFNIYNSNSWWLPANTGKLFIFPSKIQHEVQFTESKETRISLAFNVFIKGQIGREETLTSLKL